MANLNRPMTIREIQAKRKKEREAEQNKVRITNKTKLQTVTIQLFGKKDKKAINQLSIQLPPGKSVDLPESRLNHSQIDNLRKKGMLVTNKVGANGKVEKTGYRAFLNKKKDTPKEDKKVDKKTKSAKTTKKASESKTKKDTDNKSDE